MDLFCRRQVQGFVSRKREKKETKKTIFWGSFLLRLAFRRCMLMTRAMTIGGIGSAESGVVCARYGLSGMVDGGYSAGHSMTDIWLGKMDQWTTGEGY